ncbi:MAG: trimethylamine methyltransferase family protein [Caldilineaceae bacterium]
MTQESQPQRRGRAARVAERAARKSVDQRPVRPGMVGGRYQPLTQHELERIHHTVLDLMEQVGFADAIPSMIDLVTAKGGWINDKGRLCYPRSLVEDVIANAPRRFVMPGISPEHDMEVGSSRVHMGTGGASPNVVDFETGLYRPSRLMDVYDLARLVDTLDNIHYFWRPVVARDTYTTLDLDLNTSYACMMGTTKHIGVSYVNGKNCEAALAMYDMAMGGAGKFRERPFCSISCCHVVPPLRFAQESCEALEAAARGGMCLTLLSAAQAGCNRTGSIGRHDCQAVAETLAGLVFVHLIDPQCRANLGMWPFVSDLRTGAMCAGSAELALIVAGCGQMARFYDLPSSTAAGMTDSKIPDAQAGAEKAYTLALAANGQHLIMESAGMQASLLGASYEAYVIDNDILGAVQRTVRGIEVNDETLSFEVIKNVVNGDGHFLGQAQTIERMESDYVYPLVGDRDTPANWEERGAKDIRERARDRVRKTLAEHYPAHIDPKLDEKIRSTFKILLSQRSDEGWGRWGKMKG